MWKRLIALVVVLVFIGGGVAIVSLTGSSSSSANLRKLPVGSAGAGSATTEAKSGTGLAAPDVARGDMMLAPNQGTLEYTVQGTLPELGGKAAAYEVSGQGGIDDVKTLAAAFGLTGEETSKGDVSVIAGQGGQVTLQHSGMRSWSMYRAVKDANCSTSSDGTTTCTGSAPADKSAIACATPPCPPGSSCPEPATCVSPEAPTRPTDLPTNAEAEAAARAALAKLHVDLADTDVAVSDAFSSLLVTFTTRIDGQKVESMATTVNVGPKGVVQSANGFFAQPVKLGDYPLAGTAKGLERLKAGRYLMGGGYAVPMMGAGVRTADGSTGTATTVTSSASSASSGSGASASSGSGGGSAPAAPVPAPVPNRTVTITGVKLELSMVLEANGGALLVPAYRFEVEGSAFMAPVPAVVDSLLTDQVGGTTPMTAVDTGATEPAPPAATKPAAPTTSVP